MIFAETADLVLSGRKTQTLRLVRHGDTLASGVPDRCPRVVRDDGRIRWRVGGVYAVQRQRCHVAVGRIVCHRLELVEDPTDLPGWMIRAEGFDTPEQFAEVWHRLHRTKPVQPCWAIGFSLL